MDTLNVVTSRIREPRHAIAKASLNSDKPVLKPGPRNNLTR
jgi:hypothetical protein